MQTIRAKGRLRAFTLIELLSVILIIGILAALLLPALSQTKARARRVQCENYLRQIGIVFQAFAHDHNGHFPMAVPGSGGGSQEFVWNAYRIQGDFYFAFRNFQVLSNDLVTPRLLVCPADTRQPAGNFSALNNSNLSYFIALNADYTRPGSILAGDRNLTNDWAAQGALARFGPNAALRWTAELHRYKGNLLFSDGHVQEENSLTLAWSRTADSTTSDLALPITGPTGAARNPPGTLAAKGADRAPRPGASGVGKQTNAAPMVTLTRAAPASPATTTPETAPSTRPPSHSAVRSTNNPARAGAQATSPSEDSSISPFAAWLAALSHDLVRKGSWYFYLFLLLLAIGALVIRKLTRNPPPGSQE